MGLHRGLKCQEAQQWKFKIIINIIKATNTPANNQFCLLVKIVWKDQSFFVVAYQNHIYT